MRADFAVVLDACVLGNFAVCDLLLRLAETPRLYLPYWSEPILNEIQRVHSKLGWPEAISRSFRTEIARAFPDAEARGLDCCVCPDAINGKDRHVVQAALRVRAEVIVTFNLKDFPGEHLEPLDVRARHPSEFLLSLFAMEPLLVGRRLSEIARRKNSSVEAVLRNLNIHVPAFVEQFAESAGLVI